MYTVGLCSISAMLVYISVLPVRKCVRFLSTRKKKPTKKRKKRSEKNCQLCRSACAEVKRLFCRMFADVQQSTCTKVSGAEGLGTFCCC